MIPDHAYDPICGCNFCVITSASLSSAKPLAAKKADVIPLPEKQPGEVIYIDFKARKRVK